MKKRNRVLIMILALLVSVPIFWNYSTSTVSAATPKFAKSKLELVGKGEVYQVEISNKVKGSKYKWTSSDKTVVKVSSKGLLTTVGGAPQQSNVLLHILPRRQRPYPVR